MEASGVENGFPLSVDQVKSGTQIGADEFGVKISVHTEGIGRVGIRLIFSVSDSCVKIGPVHSIRCVEASLIGCCIGGVRRLHR